MTRALAPKNTERCGVAAREERMVPLPYSPLIDNTLRIPMTSDAKANPASEVFVGSKFW